MATVGVKGLTPTRHACLWTGASEGVDDNSSTVDDSDSAWADPVRCVRQLTNDDWTWHSEVRRHNHVTKVLLQHQYS